MHKQLMLGCAVEAFPVPSERGRRLSDLALGSFPIEHPLEVEFTSVGQV